MMKFQTEIPTSSTYQNLGSLPAEEPKPTDHMSGAVFSIEDTKSLTPWNLEGPKPTEQVKDEVLHNEAVEPKSLFLGNSDAESSKHLSTDRPLSPSGVKSHEGIKNRVNSIKTLQKMKEKINIQEKNKILYSDLFGDSSDSDSDSEGKLVIQTESDLTMCNKTSNMSDTEYEGAVPTEKPKPVLQMCDEKPKPVLQMCDEEKVIDDTKPSCSIPGNVSSSILNHPLFIISNPLPPEIPKITIQISDEVINTEDKKQTSLTTKDLDVEPLSQYEAEAPSTSYLGNKKRISRWPGTNASGVVIYPEIKRIPTDVETLRMYGKIALERITQPSFAIPKRLRSNAAKSAKSSVSRKQTSKQSDAESSKHLSTDRPLSPSGVKSHEGIKNRVNSIKTLQKMKEKINIQEKNKILYSDLFGDSSDSDSDSEGKLVIQTESDLTMCNKTSNMSDTEYEDETTNVRKEGIHLDMNTSDMRGSKRLLGKESVSCDLVRRKKQKCNYYQPLSPVNSTMDCESLLRDRLLSDASQTRNNVPKSPPLTNVSTSSKPFLLSYYQERTEADETLTKNESAPKQTDIKDIISCKKTVDLSNMEMCTVHENILLQAYDNYKKLRTEYDNIEKLRQKMYNDHNHCIVFLNNILNRSSSFTSNVNTFKTFSPEAQAKSLVHSFPTEVDVNPKAVKPKKKFVNTILQEKQLFTVCLINRHFLGFNPKHPLMKCLASEINNYVRHMREDKLKISKSMQVTELLALLCRRYNLTKIAEAFVCDVLYWMKMAAYPLVYSMLKICPNILPNSQNNMASTMSLAIVHSILQSPSNSKHVAHAYLHLMKDVLWNQYDYSVDQPKTLEILQTMMKRLTEPDCIAAIALICKRENFQFVNQHVISYLLDLLRNKNVKNEEFANAAMRLIGIVVRSFPHLYSDVIVNNLISTLRNMLFSPEGSQLFKEEIALVLCHLARFNLTDCATILFQWQPPVMSVSMLTSITKVLMYLQKSNQWIEFIKKQQNLTFDFRNLPSSSRNIISYEDL